MKKTISILLAFLMGFVFVNAQGITTHQYRRVAPADMQEYLKRETTYWQKFAESEVTKGNLTFWGIFQKVGGINLEHAPNILIINTFNNIDEQLNWGGVADLFPDVKMEDINTFNMSTTTSTIYIRDQNNHISAPGVNSFDYVKIIYHNPKDTGKLLKFEADKWKPMLEQAMKDGKTTMKGWGNGRILHPSSSKFPYTSYSYDLFSSLKDVLLPAFSDDVDLFNGFFDDIEDNEEGARSIVLYRIVAVVTAPEGGE